MAAGQLPAGGPPVTDGRSTANVLDPEVGAGDLGIVTDDRLQIVTLPDAAWARAWRDSLDLIPAGDGGGYVLVGAPALAIVSDHGGITASPLPDGYVALAPTSDPDRFLLATSDDAAEAGGLSASTPFGAYLWKRGSTEPMLVKDRVVQVRASTQGLAWLQDAAGAWFDLTLSGEAKRFVDDDRSAIEVSPDGSVIVWATDARSGCDVLATDPCTIVIEGRTGARVMLVGPADGIAVANGAVGVVLRPRPSLDLPWRLVSGDPLDPTITPID
jgi:hypothetical protein